MNLDPLKNTVVICFKNPKIFLPSFFIYLLFAILLFLSRDAIVVLLVGIIGSIFLSSFYPAIIKNFLEKKKFFFYKEIFPAIKRIPKIFLLQILLNIIIMSPLLYVTFILFLLFLNSGGVVFAHSYSPPYPILLLDFFLGLLYFTFFIPLLPSIYLLSRLLFAVPIFVLNKYGIFESIKKSWEFTRKRTLGVLLNLILLIFVPSLINLPLILILIFVPSLIDVVFLTILSIFYVVFLTILSTLYMFFTTYFYLYFKGKKSRI